MDTKKFSDLLNDDSKAKQAVMDRFYNDINIYKELEIMSLREFYSQLDININFNYFETIYYRSKEKLSKTESKVKEVVNSKTNSPINNNPSINKKSSNSNKIKLNGISERLLNEISESGFSEDDIKSWFNKNDLITSINLRRKFEQIKSETNNKYK